LIVVELEPFEPFEPFDDLLAGNALRRGARRREDQPVDVLPER
jgi:hypothetical protein